MVPRMTAEQKLTPEAVVKLHLQALTAGAIPAREAIGTLTLPRSRSIRFERTGNTANEWKYDLTVLTIEVTGPGGTQGPGAPLFIDPRAVTP
jgi:hypothetical protein